MIIHEDYGTWQQSIFFIFKNLIPVICVACMISLMTFHLWLRPKWNRHNFADIIFKCILVNESHYILILISLKFVPDGVIHKVSALVQIMTLLNRWWAINPSPRGQNGCHFTDHIFTSIFMNDKFFTFIKISLKFVSEGSIDNNPALI